MAVVENYSRMTAIALRSKVHAVLRAWRSWFVFSEDYLDGLMLTFNGGPQSQSALAALSKIGNEAKRQEGASADGIAAAKRALAAYEDELSSMGMEELARLCARGGLPGGGGESGRQDMVLRLTAAKAQKIANGLDDATR